MNVTVHRSGYLCLVVEDHINHVVVTLVRMVEHVKLLVELIILVIVFHVSFYHIACYLVSCLNDLHSN